MCVFLFLLFLLKLYEESWKESGEKKCKRDAHRNKDPRPGYPSYLSFFVFLLPLFGFDFSSSPLSNLDLDLDCEYRFKVGTPGDPPSSRIHSSDYVIGFYYCLRRPRQIELTPNGGWGATFDGCSNNKIARGLAWE